MTIISNCKAFAPLLVLYAVFFSNYAISLELTKFEVPLRVPLGIRANLLCQWTLGPNDKLYSVKWYKDGEEFFRHVPRDVEPLKKFLLPGVDVEEFNSSGAKLTVAPVTVASSGRYRCEVSGERPQFQTVSKYADIIVIVLPSHELKIHGFTAHYSVGDHVNATCSSSQSQPAVILAWYINGELASHTLRLRYIKNGPNSLGIEFTVVKRLVGYLKLQCIATVGSTYWRSIEKRALVTEISEYTLNNSTSHSTNTQRGGQGTNGHNLLIPSSFMLLFFYFC